MKFVACLPPEAKTPVKPMTGKKLAGRRLYRVWLDAYMLPEQAEAVMEHEGNFFVTLDPETPVTVNDSGHEPG